MPDDKQTTEGYFQKLSKLTSGLRAEPPKPAVAPAKPVMNPLPSERKMTTAEIDRQNATAKAIADRNQALADQATKASAKTTTRSSTRSSSRR